MLKLYRTADGVTEYWQAWEHNPKRVIVHWGKLGENGESRRVSVGRDDSPSRLIEREAGPLRADGFKPVNVDEMAQVVIQYKIGQIEPKKHLIKVQTIESLVNECLGRHGLGSCDGFDIGVYTLNVLCDVVDGPASEQIVVDCLKQKRQLEGAVIARRERAGDQSYVVFWPEDFNGVFHLL